MNRIILALLVTTVVYAGCKKEDDITTTPPCIDYDYIRGCLSQYIPIAFYNNDTTGLDTIIVTTYSRGQQFSNASGSTTFTDKYEKVSTSGFLAFKNIKITDTLDYLIELPATNKQYYVSAATIQPLVDTVWCNEHRGGYGYCYSWSQYFIVNGDTVQPYRYGNFELVLLLNK